MHAHSHALLNKYTFHTRIETQRCRKEMTVTEIRLGLVHKHENQLPVSVHVPRACGPHSQTLAARQNSVILCLEDAKALAAFVTFAATVRSVSPSLEMMINFCYLHCRPGGSSTGFTHLSFPLHCFSNGDEIERIAPWVCLSTTPLSVEGAARKCICW